MDTGDMERDLGAAVTRRLGMEVAVRLIHGDVDNCVWMRVHAPHGPLSHAAGDGYLMKGQRKGKVGAGTLRHLLSLPYEDRIARLCDDLSPRLEASLPFYAYAHRVHSAHVRDDAPMDLSIGCLPAYSSGAHYQVAWTGIDVDLAIRRQTMSLAVKQPGDKLDETIRGIVDRRRRLTVLTPADYVLDIPLRTILAEAGCDADDLLDAARGHGFKAGKGELRTQAGFRHAGVDMSLTVREGRIQAEITLAAGVVWKRGSLVIRNMTLPDTLRQAARGRRLRDLVDHPWLEGLTAASASQSDGGSGSTTTIATLAEAT